MLSNIPLEQTKIFAAIQQLAMTVVPLPKVTYLALKDPDFGNLIAV